MQIIVDFLEWISKINLLDISIFIFYIINAGLIIFLSLKALKRYGSYIKKIMSKDRALKKSF